MEIHRPHSAMDGLGNNKHRFSGRNGGVQSGEMRGGFLTYF